MTAVGVVMMAVRGGGGDDGGRGGDDGGRGGDDVGGGGAMTAVAGGDDGGMMAVVMMAVGAVREPPLPPTPQPHPTPRPRPMPQPSTPRPRPMPQPQPSTPRRPDRQRPDHACQTQNGRAVGGRVQNGVHKTHQRPARHARSASLAARFLRTHHPRCSGAGANSPIYR
jgi:hypothetical protein